MKKEFLPMLLSLNSITPYHRTGAAVQKEKAKTIDYLFSGVQ
jgi:hypothetical protein